MTKFIRLHRLEPQHPAILVNPDCITAFFLRGHDTTVCLIDKDDIVVTETPDEVLEAVSKVSR